MADLVAENLAKEFPTPTDPLVILSDVSLRLSRGENLGILGPSGTGKSTLLQILGTLDKPTSGRLRIQGQDPFDLKEPDLARFRSRQIGFVFQDHYLLPQLTAIENVLLPTLAEGKPSRATIDRGRNLLDRVGLSHRVDHRPAELSGGERQRVAIARALIHQPLLVLADEPTGNLDPSTADSVANLLIELQGIGQDATMLVVVTHSAAFAERLQHCQKLEQGQLSFGGTGV